MKHTSEVYLSHLNEIMGDGTDQEARGLKFREIMGAVYTVEMSNPIILIPSRELGYRFAVAEPYWILSGSNLLSEITKFGKMAPYSDDGYFMSGAYGPKIVDQLGYVCRTLADDLGSRQAVINIWREKPGKSKDIPCTLSLQFLIREGKINCMATMRSSDAYMGLPYDSILFSLASAYVLSILKEHYGEAGLKLGKLKVFLGSAHVYDRDFENIERILDEWDFRVDESIDFNVIANTKPPEFLEILQSYALDEDGSGILEISSLK